MSGSAEPPPFQRVDWSRVDRSDRSRSTAHLVALVGFSVLVLAFAYDRMQGGVYVTENWRPLLVDWTFFAALWTLVAYGLVPALIHRDPTAELFATIRSNRILTLAFVYLTGFGLVGRSSPQVLPA